MKKTIDISNYSDFIDAGFKECAKCGWAFSPDTFDDHKCDEMKRPFHGHPMRNDGTTDTCADCPENKKTP